MLDESVVRKETVAAGVPVAEPVEANWLDAVENRKRVIRKRKDRVLDVIAVKEDR